MGPVKSHAAVPGRRGRPSQGVREAVLAATRRLIREQGLAGATSRAIADRAGASEASIHYHFGGKDALLEAAILEALGPLGGYDGSQTTSSKDSAPSMSLLQVAKTLERSYEELLPLLAAVQSDPQLRQTIAPRLSRHDLGPHRAVGRVAACLSASNPNDGAADGFDAEAAALLIVGACFLRAWQRAMSTHRPSTLPSLQRALAVLPSQRPNQ